MDKPNLWQIVLIALIACFFGRFVTYLMGF